MTVKSLLKELTFNEAANWSKFFEMINKGKKPAVETDWSNPATVEDFLNYD